MENRLGIFSWKIPKSEMALKVKISSRFADLLGNPQELSCGG
jgi:hypothetical protein